MKSWFQHNDIEMHSIHNEGESVVAERLKNKIYKYMTSISTNVYIDKLVDIVNKYNNIYHSTVKMKPVNVHSSTCIDFNVEKNDKDPKFKVSDHTRISKHKNILTKKVILQIGLKKFL